jgi:phosphoribosylformylglycinamidine (FGAM) synthase-like amidotransferase family enzyme
MPERVRVGVVTFPGSCDDRDALRAAGLCGAVGVPVWHGDVELPDVDAVVIPGGFSYGDYLRPGALARFSPAMTAVRTFAEAGGPVLGICNGFQILCEAGAPARRPDTEPRRPLRLSSRGPRRRARLALDGRTDRRATCSASR